MFGLPQEVIVLAAIGVIAGIILGIDKLVNVIVKLFAGVTFVCGLAPIGVGLLMMPVTDASLLLEFIVWVVVVTMLMAVAWLIAKPSEFNSEGRSLTQ